MYQFSRVLRRLPLCAILMSSVLAGCSQSMDALDNITTSSLNRTSTHGYPTSERDCLARAMFFESIRSSREGLVAVGTVVMNRVDSDAYPDTICGVVGQKNQFAPGVLSRKMDSKALPDVMAAADAVLAGERHPAAKNAHHFHQAGLKFPYKNMHYVLEAGGNAFYERLNRTQMAALRDTGKKPASQASLAAFSTQDRGADIIGQMLAEQAVSAD